MRTFPFEVLRDRKVPQLDSFERLVSFLRRELEHIDCFQWAIVAGSVLRGQQTVASDLDLVASWKLGTAAEARMAGLKRLGECRAYAADLRIDLDLCVVSAEALLHDCHTLNPGYVGHLRWAVENGGLLAGDTSNLRAMPFTTLEDAQSYLARKIKKCEVMLSTPPFPNLDTVWLDWLKDILTSFKHAMRRVAELYGFQEDSGLVPLDSIFNTRTLNLYLRLEESRQAHLQAMQEQLEMADPHRGAWRTELARLAEAGSTLYLFFLSLQEELWVKFP